MTYTKRLHQLCSLHKTAFAYAATDLLDGGRVDLATAFDYYEAKCSEGQGCA